MAESVEIPGVSKIESTELTLFIPSVSRDLKPIDQRAWEQAALELLGRCFGGATAFPKGRGVWRDDRQGGKLIYDETIIILCYTNREAFDGHLTEFHTFLAQKGKETNQGAVGFVLEGSYMEILMTEAANG